MMNVKYDFSALAKTLAVAAGARLRGAADDTLEISPLVSYSGEGLEALAGRELGLPLVLAQL